MITPTLLWHDYETWGLNPRLDRPSQFAALRTDFDLNIIGEPIELYCKPALDFIPHPQSVLITGLTPQVADEKGIIESEFTKAIHAAMSEPGTCGVGYNSIRFDDEVTRFGFYRNFYDPYAREWQNGNSRWDILDLVRMCWALRPDGINWPEREPGVPSFRLEDLSVANGIEHSSAHDALADVHATLGLARVIKQAQPKLYQFYFELRNKAKAAQMLNLSTKEPLLHISGMYPSVEGCIAPVMPLCTHPRNKNEIIVFDLRQNPFALFNTPADEIAQHLFTKKADLPEGIKRVAIKGVHINKSPALAPMNTLSPEMAEKWGFDLKQVNANRERVLYFEGLESKVHAVFSANNHSMATQDADGALYGGFITRPERAVCDQILAKNPQDLIKWEAPFQEPRLQTIYNRYLGRNWPELLSEQQQTQWQDYVAQKLVEGEHGCNFTLDDYFTALSDAETELNDLPEPLSEDALHKRETLLAQLNDWIEAHFTNLA